MRLTAVVDLMLKQVQQQRGHAFLRGPDTPFHAEKEPHELETAETPIRESPTCKPNETSNSRAAIDSGSTMASTAQAIIDRMRQEIGGHEVGRSVPALLSCNLQHTTYSYWYCSL